MEAPSFDGYWVITFSTGDNIGRGVVAARANTLFGGDSSYTYLGNYSQEGDKVTARVYLRRHSAASINVFGIEGNYGLDFTVILSSYSVALGATVGGSHAVPVLDIRMDRINEADPSFKG